MKNGGHFYNQFSSFIRQTKPETRARNSSSGFFCLIGKDVFAALSTGYGKSLCYACLPYAFDIASFPGPRSASCCVQYGKRREAMRGPGNEATSDNREAKKDGFL